MIFYFSGTGNSKWIANQLSKEQKEELFFIPDALKNRTFEFCLRKDEKGSVVILGGLSLVNSLHAYTFASLKRKKLISTTPLNDALNALI
ncbi:hypothetical protein P0M15_26855, partial [Bacteroides xylanisolvens]|nr:hypothetical protein [Bacteroides xylanisolvens]